MAKTARSPMAEASPPAAADKHRSGSGSASGSGLRSLASAASGWWDRWAVMGSGLSKLERAFGDQFPEGERYFGLENFGNTCYCNSVLQALYYCTPFREQLLDYYAKNRNLEDAEENLLTCLADLFSQISASKKKTGVIAPKRFIQMVRKLNEYFRGYMHQVPVLMNAVGGILVGLVTTYAGGVRKGFVIVSALLVTALLQFIFDGKPPSHYCLMALPLVMTSIFIYQKYPYADRKKKD